MFNVAWPGGADDTNMYVGGGDSWIGAIEFGDEVKAKVLLTYGNATQKDSPHKGDQLELFSKKEMRDAWITKVDIISNTERVEVMRGNGFKKKD